MLDQAQLALASPEERARALAYEQQIASREAARIARERALAGNEAAAGVVRAAFLPLKPDPAGADVPVPEGVVGND